MKLNEKNVSSFASSDSPVDKEGYLSRKNDVKGLQRRWYVLKGNLLFAYERKQDKDPSYLLVLESCSVQASATEKHGFEISYDGPGTRTYILVADNDEDMQSWMRAVSHASYEFLKSIVIDLQKQVDSLTSRSQAKQDSNTIKKSPSDNKLPILSKPKQKVENGILVDVEDIPPVPPKKRLSGQRSNEPAATNDSTTPYVINPHKPHSNPVVIPTITGTSRPLSPPGTLDRTPIMLPTIAIDDDYDVPVSNATTEDDVEIEQNVRPFVDMPSNYSPTVVRSMAAPPTTHTNVYDIHYDFTDALHSLQSASSTCNTTSSN